jgi:hypothetical protein
MERVEPRNSIGAIEQALLHHQLAAAPHQRQQVVQRVFPVILLALGHGVRTRCRV